MKTKYVCRGLISLYVNFHNNRTMWSTKLHVKICRWGEKEKEPTIPAVPLSLALFSIGSSAGTSIDDTTGTCLGSGVQR